MIYHNNFGENAVSEAFVVRMDINSEKVNVDNKKENADDDNKDQ